MPDIQKDLPYWSTNRLERLTQILMTILRRNGGSIKVSLEDYWKMLGEDLAIVHQLDRKTHDLVVRLVPKHEADRMKADAVAAVKEKHDRRKLN